MTNEEAIVELRDLISDDRTDKENEALLMAIKALRDERPHGKWIEHQDCHDDTYYTCSHCGEDWTTIEGDPMDNLMNYCPMCGAEMRGADNEC